MLDSPLRRLLAHATLGAGTRRFRVPALRAALIVWATLGAPPVTEARRTGPQDVGRKVPADVEAFQDRIDAVLGAARPATVGLRRSGASGSGVLVSADGLVLTAAHVVGEPGVACRVLLDDGRELRGESLGANHLRDAAMVRILEPPADLPFVDVPPPGPLAEGTWCLALGHPGGFVEGRGAVPRLGRVLDPGGRYVWTDSPLIGGDSGGPLFTLDGALVGIHSRIEEDVANNYHVPLSTFRLGWRRLLAGEEWRRASARLGVVDLSDARPGARLERLRDGRPAALAGVLAGDVVTALNGEAVRDTDHLRWFLGDLSPGDAARLTLRRGAEELTLAVTLGGVPGGRR